MSDKYTVQSVTGDVLEDFELTKGSKIPRDSLAQAKKWAVEYLQHPHSEQELRTRLAQKGASQADIDVVAALCIDYGFVDDEEYAGQICRHYAAKGYGPGRIRAELSRRGVAKEYWDEALAALPEDTDAIDRLLAARLRGRDLSDRKVRDSVAASLHRRGYSWDDIRSALRRCGAEEE